jgi:hypothetical protein
MVMNVATPARISVKIVEPRSCKAQENAHQSEIGLHASLLGSI